MHARELLGRYIRRASTAPFEPGVSDAGRKREGGCNFAFFSDGSRRGGVCASLAGWGMGFFEMVEGGMVEGVGGELESGRGRGAVKGF